MPSKATSEGRLLSIWDINTNSLIPCLLMTYFFIFMLIKNLVGPFLILDDYKCITNQKINLRKSFKFFFFPMTLVDLPKLPFMPSLILKRINFFSSIHVIKQKLSSWYFNFLSKWVISLWLSNLFFYSLNHLLVVFWMSKIILNNINRIARTFFDRNVIILKVCVSLLRINITIPK